MITISQLKQAFVEGFKKEAGDLSKETTIGSLFSTIGKRVKNMKNMFGGALKIKGPTTPLAGGKGVMGGTGVNRGTTTLAKTYPGLQGSSKGFNFSEFMQNPYVQQGAAGTGLFLGGMGTNEFLSDDDNGQSQNIPQNNFQNRFMR